MSDNVYVLGAARTPIGSFQGALSSLSAPDLGAHAIRAALADAGLTEDAVNEVIMGNVISAGLKQAPARQAMRNAGLPDSCHALTVNKVCGSGLKAIALGADAVALATASMIAIGCQQYRVCNSGKCPMGIATQNSDLCCRLNIDQAAKNLKIFCGCRPRNSKILPV